MKKMNYQNVKGTQDYLPNVEMIRSKIRRTLEDTFIQYGCKPLETPILNYSSLLSSKYGGGAEILKEMYTLTDQGQRELALRYDLTIPFAKVIAMNPTLRMPFKRYEIGKVFRDGPIKAGRFREFTQCDVDIVGVSTQAAEAELMGMALSAFEKLQLPVIIQYNNRKLLQGMLSYIGVQNDSMNSVILTIDKYEKVGLSGIEIELSSKNISGDIVLKIISFLKTSTSKGINYFEQFTDKNEDISQGVAELKELEEYLSYLNMKEQCVFNPYLARGLEMYTGTIYEIFLEDGTINSSIGSGGRYDNAIGGLIGTEEIFSTVGISFGLDVITTAYSMNHSLTYSSNIDFYIIPIKATKEGLLLATQLRKKGYLVELEMKIKNLQKALDRANKEGLKKVIIIGENEIKKNRIQVKDMETGEILEESFNFVSKR
ncbi:histidine--tRNA ligase [Rummeliibacillus pycnus]|uniref:histidine--tRNA ligase n=1 Tax=Rummeliibacillus pycnus TaxID=101070 RepID=UPI0037C51406